MCLVDGLLILVLGMCVNLLEMVRVLGFCWVCVVVVVVEWDGFWDVVEIVLSYWGVVIMVDGDEYVMGLCGDMELVCFVWLWLVVELGMFCWVVWMS